jgi:hypothetical protein
MAVRRKLDLAGIKLKLQHWSELDEAERAQAKELPRPAEAPTTTTTTTTATTTTTTS